MSQQPIFIEQWKETMIPMIKDRFRNTKLSRKKLDQYLDTLIQQKINNRKVMLINNYMNKSVRTDILSLIDTIETNRLVIAGGGTLFYPHDAKRNLLAEFIVYKMDERDAAKVQRSNYDKGTNDWLVWDIAQSNLKLLINSLYGCLGYERFVLYNVFLAEAITNEGRHIITSAIACFEHFLGDGVVFTCETELYGYLSNIAREHKARRNKKLDASFFAIENLEQKVLRRLADKCVFGLTERQMTNLAEYVGSKEESELILLWYKNNLNEFNQNTFIKEKYRYICENNQPLVIGDIDLLDTPEIKQAVQDIWDFYETFVLYDYPVYDRIRKAMYQDKTRCLYTDTDSVFISLSGIVKYVTWDVLQGKSKMTEDELSGTIASVSMIYLNQVVDRAMKTLCSSTGIPPEYAKRLTMKNEFFLKRIVFVEEKKRYISLALLQEGKVLGHGKGLPEIKGFDFIKSTTKPYLKKFYETLSVTDILTPSTIRPGEVFRKMVHLKQEIEESIRSGDSKFYKQSNVKRPAEYKNPYSIQGVTSILLWNALCPDSQMDFPNDVNIVPIKSMCWGTKKNKKDFEDYAPTDVATISDFKEKWPKDYKRVEKTIYRNRNDLIRHMTLSYIALPKNSAIPIPDCIWDLVDYEKITTDALRLFLPIMKSIGLNDLPVSTNVSHMSNIVSM